MNIIYAIEKAADLIKQGIPVAFPTETVYGLGADASNEEACRRIYEAKNRPSINPLIVHVASLPSAQEIAIFNESALKIAKALWPGPLTLVLPKKDDAVLADCVTAGLTTVALRIPSSDIALELIRRSGCPIAAPSANKSGTLSTTTYRHVKKNFGDKIFILPSEEKSTYGIESTILDLSTQVPAILRPGFITPDIIAKLSGREIAISSSKAKVKAPGMLFKHYAPETKLRLDANLLYEAEIGLNFGEDILQREGSLNLSHEGNLIEAAANLFNYLHILDEFRQKNNIATIAVAPIPDTGIGMAINDRLSRASAKENSKPIQG